MKKLYAILLLSVALPLSAMDDGSYPQTRKAALLTVSGSLGRDPKLAALVREYFAEQQKLVTGTVPKPTEVELEFVDQRYPNLSSDQAKAISDLEAQEQFEAKNSNALSGTGNTVVTAFNDPLAPPSDDPPPVPTTLEDSIHEADDKSDYVSDRETVNNPLGDFPPDAVALVMPSNSPVNGEDSSSASGWSSSESASQDEKTEAAPSLSEKSEKISLIQAAVRTDFSSSAAAASPVYVSAGKSEEGSDRGVSENPLEGSGAEVVEPFTPSSSPVNNGDSLEVGSPSSEQSTSEDDEKDAPSDVRLPSSGVSKKSTTTPTPPLKQSGKGSIPTDKSKTHWWKNPDAPWMNSRIVAPASFAAVIISLSRLHVRRQRALGKPTIFDRILAGSKEMWKKSTKSARAYWISMRRKKQQA